MSSLLLVLLLFFGSAVMDFMLRLSLDFSVEEEARGGAPLTRAIPPSDLEADDDFGDFELLLVAEDFLPSADLGFFTLAELPGLDFSSEDETADFLPSADFGFFTLAELPGLDFSAADEEGDFPPSEDSPGPP